MKDQKRIQPDMTLLEVVDRWRETVPVFQARDGQAGECLLCNALFDTVARTAERYGLDLEVLLDDLEAAAQE